MRRILRKLFKKHYKKIQLIERIVQYGQDIRWFFVNYSQVLIDAGLGDDVEKLKKTGDKLLKDIKNLFRVY